MATANEKLQIAAIDHSHDVIRYQNQVVYKVIALLNRTDKDLFIQLTAALQQLPVSQFTVERLDSLLASVRNINAVAYQKIRHELQTELADLVAYEQGYQQQLFQNTLPVTFEVATVPVAQVVSSAMARPFQGRLLSEWMAGLEAEKAAKIRDAIRIGYVEGQTIPEMVARLRGTKAKQYQDGILEITRRNAETIVRTAVSHTANHTRHKFAEANDDLVKGWKFLATMDSRVTVLCASLDGKVFPIGEGPQPPRHMNCRSSSTFVLRSWKELGIDLKEFPEGTRATYDGQVPANLTYGEWLKSKPAAFQDEVLGKTKGKLFRAGMPIDSFVNRAGNVLTLDELRKKDAAMFAKAGV